MKQLSEAQLELIKKPLEPKAVSNHPTKRGMSSIKPIFITERFNEVFGVGQWKINTEIINIGENGLPYLFKMYTTAQNKERSEYFALLKTTFTVPEYGIAYECIAGASNDDLGDATKGAISDSISKIGSWIGIGIDVFKGQQEIAVREWEQNEADRKTQELKKAVAALTRCMSVDDLKQLRDSLPEDITTDPFFKGKATERYNQINPQDPQRSSPAA